MLLSAVLFAIDPVGLGGVVLRSAAGPARERWLADLASLLPEGTPWRRVPIHIDDDRLLGGLDLTATLQAGRPVALRGLLAEADGGVAVLAMAERLAASTAARLAASMDSQSLVVERHGMGSRHACRIGVVALDEGLPDEHAPAALRERLALHVELMESRDPASDGDWSRDDVLAARARLPGVIIDDASIEGLCAAALALGIDSLRAPLLAGRVARALAALDGRDAASTQDAALAAGLVLAPRATRIPSAEDAQQQEADDDDATPSADNASATEASSDAERDDSASQGMVDDMVLQAALSSLPSNLLAALKQGERRAPSSATAGKVGASRESRSRGRPIGSKSGEPVGGARLDVIGTLRAAAPWQAVRRREFEASGKGLRQGAGPGHGSGPDRLQIRREDFRVWRFQQRSETTTVFVIDASGSSALHRLAEAKGAIELMLADCYVRRDSVAVIAFRGPAAELLLPPTRSLARARRNLAGLPGGGGTPLAAGIDAAVALGIAIRRRGSTPLVVLLTDGRANIARDGTPGRAKATDDARSSAQQLRVEGITALLLDTSPQPQASARQLADDMAARYLPLPHAGAERMSQAVRDAASSASMSTV